MTSQHDFFGLVCTDNTPYVNWQCQVLGQTWDDVGQRGELVRLVAAPAGVPLPTHRHARVVRTDPPATGTTHDHGYLPLNRLTSMLEWLRVEQPEGTVLVLDPDMVLRSPIELVVGPGSPVAQPWHGAAPGQEPFVMLAEEIGVDAESMDLVTWPALVHTSDLEALLPRWIELTMWLRDRLGYWESDMYAFVAAATELGWTWDHGAMCAWMNWPEDVVAGAPIIHYCQPVEAHDGRTLWFKGDYQPWDPIVADPADAALDYTRDLLAILQEVIATRTR